MHTQFVDDEPWLTADAAAGATTITVGACDGWNVGEAIAVAATGGTGTHYGEIIHDHANYESERRIIAAVTVTDDGNECVVTLDAALGSLHRGSLYDGIVPMYAEVLNLNRSVTFTGDMYWKDEENKIKGAQGITTAQMDGGVQIMRYARVENCGRVELGKYCVHQHLLGHCPECAIQGVAVEFGVNKGITVHGTHDSLIDGNVVYDV